MAAVGGLAAWRACQPTKRWTKRCSRGPSRSRSAPSAASRPSQSPRSAAKTFQISSSDGSAVDFAVASSAWPRSPAGPVGPFSRGCRAPATPRRGPGTARRVPGTAGWVVAPALAGAGVPASGTGLARTAGDEAPAGTPAVTPAGEAPTTRPSAPAGLRTSRARTTRARSRISHRPWTSCRSSASAWARERPSEVGQRPSEVGGGVAGAGASRDEVAGQPVSEDRRSMPGAPRRAMVGGRQAGMAVATTGDSSLDRSHPSLRSGCTARGLGAAPVTSVAPAGDRQRGRAVSREACRPRLPCLGEVAATRLT